MLHATTFLAFALLTAPVSAGTIDLSLQTSQRGAPAPGPIVVRATLRNSGREPVTVVSRMTTNSSPVRYFVLTPEKARLRISVDAYVSSKYPLLTLKPGEAIHHDVLFMFVNDKDGNEIYPLSDLRSFSILAEYDDGKLKASAPPIPVASSPDVRSDRPATSFWRDRGELAGALGRGCPVPC